MKFVWIVIDDLPEEFGQRTIVGVYSNKRAADAQVKAYRQQDEFKHQYVVVDRWAVRKESNLIPVRKRA